MRFSTSTKRKPTIAFAFSIILKNAFLLKRSILRCRCNQSRRRCSSTSSCKVSFFFFSNSPIPCSTHEDESFPQLTSGTYRILNGLQSARSFPPATQQGPFETEITFSEQFASVWEDVCFFFVVIVVGLIKMSVGTRF